MSCDLENYLCADRGLLLPLVSEYTWAHGGRAVLYGIGLFWSLMAVSIIADIFMAAIETITLGHRWSRSQMTRKRVTRK